MEKNEAHICNPSTGETDVGGSWGLLNGPSS